MTSAGPHTPQTLCLGEAIVDLIGEERGSTMRQIRRFVPHCGGTVANVAVHAARAGASIALVGGAGEDDWGRWLVERLAAERVDMSRFALLPGTNTQLAFVAVDAEGEASYELYAEPAQSLVRVMAESAESVIDGAGGLLIGSNTLAGEEERAVTMRAVRAALARGCPFVFDCNLRLHRWPSPAAAAEAARACVPGAALVRANQPEAELMTGTADPERAAAELCAAGARAVVISLGTGGAILRGEAEANVAAVPAEVRSTVGAGDAFTGVLLAQLAQNGFSAASAAAALDEAAVAAARACEHWGALD